MRETGQEGGGGGGDQIQKSEKDQVRKLSLKKRKKIYFLVASIVFLQQPSITKGFVKDYQQEDVTKVVSGSYSLGLQAAICCVHVQPCAKASNNVWGSVLY